MYIARYAKQSFFCILEKFDCFATLHKTLSVWAKGLRPFTALTATRHSGGTLYGIHGFFNLCTGSFSYLHYGELL